MKSKLSPYNHILNIRKMSPIPPEEIITFIATKKMNFLMSSFKS